MCGAARTVRTTQQQQRGANEPLSDVQGRYEAITGRGRIALVSGEAGGKTSFVERFIETRGKTVRILYGNWDLLFTPTPLGPLYDIARQIGVKPSAQLESMRCAPYFALAHGQRGLVLSSLGALAGGSAGSPSRAPPKPA